MPEEDTRLRELVARHGEKSWIRIASEMGNRSDIQCRYRFKQLDNALRMEKHEIERKPQRRQMLPSIQSLIADFQIPILQCPRAAAIFSGIG
jgi:hypothetical protein